MNLFKSEGSLFASEIQNEFPAGTCLVPVPPILPGSRCEHKFCARDIFVATMECWDFPRKSNKTLRFFQAEQCAYSNTAELSRGICFRIDSNFSRNVCVVTEILCIMDEISQLEKT